LAGLFSTIFTKALISIVVVEFEGIATVIGVKPGLAGCERVTVLALADVEMRKTIGILKFWVLGETAGAANQKAVSVCPFTRAANKNNKMTTKKNVFFFIFIETILPV